MTVKTSSLARVMIVVAVVAVNLALLRAAPIQMIVSPFPWILLGVVNFFLIRKCVLRPGLTHHFSQGFEPVHSTNTRFSTRPGDDGGGCSSLYCSSPP